MDESEGEYCKSRMTTISDYQAVGDDFKQGHETESLGIKQMASKCTKVFQSSTEMSPKTVVDPNKTPIATLSKSDSIRRTLREREKRLSALVKESSRRLNSVSDGVPPEMPMTDSIESGFIPDKLPPMIFEGKEESDRNEAMKTLSKAILTLKGRLEQEKSKTYELKKEVAARKLSFQRKGIEALGLVSETRKLKETNEKLEEEMVHLKEQLEEHQAVVKNIQAENFMFKREEVSLRGQLVVARQKIQSDSTSQREHLDFLEYEVLSKNEKIDNLKQELNERLKRIVELEVALETHSHRYHESFMEWVRNDGAMSYGNVDTGAALMDTPLGQDPPEILKKPILTQGISRFFRRLKSKNKIGRNQQFFFRTAAPGNLEIRLRSEIASLESRYIRDQFAAKIKIEELKQENSEYRIQILSTLELASTQQVGPMNAGSSHPISSLPSRTRFLEEKVASLENERTLQSRLNENLKTEIVRLEVNSKKQSQLNEEVLQNLRLDNEVKDVKLSSFEHELRTTTEKSSDFSNYIMQCNTISGLEAKLRESFTEKLRLHREGEVKDMTINALRQDIVGLRIQLFKNQDEITHSGQEVVNQGLTYRDMDTMQSGVCNHMEFQALPAVKLLHVHNE